MLTPAVSLAPLRVLLVEDNPFDAELVIAAVESAGYTIASVARVETARQFIDQLAKPVDVILCDYSLPAFNALAALQLMQESRCDIPFIIVSGSIGEETAVEAIKRGAADYLLKDRLGRLGSAIAHALSENQLRIEAGRAAENLRQSEIKYRSLFEHLPQAAYLCDAKNARIFDTNPRGERLLGLERAAILGMRLGHFLPQAVCRDLLALPEATTIEVDSEIVVSEGRKIFVHLTATVTVISQRRLLLAFFRESRPLENRP
ncbi:MAG TPA: response regulator [Opitutaceae bacterium]|nr:response regulator [Opitutaceae bacterium]